MKHLTPNEFIIAEKSLPTTKKNVSLEVHYATMSSIYGTAKKSNQLKEIWKLSA